MKVSEDGTGRRVALIHFTLPPNIGGIERMVEAQGQVLARAGFEVRAIAGSGGVLPGTDTRILPLLNPSHPEVRRAVSSLSSTIPPANHPLVLTLVGELEAALEGCGQCWVHNALTVYLHPFLSVALARLTWQCPGIRWVAWCSDLTAASRYWPALTEEETRNVQAGPATEYVTISEARRADLHQYLGIREEDITVIPPPIDVLDWIGATGETGTIWQSLNLSYADPLVLAPAKLLPHKGLGLAVGTLPFLPPTARLLITGAPSPHDPETSAATLVCLQRLAAQCKVEGRVHVLSAEGQAPARDTVRDLMLLGDLVLLTSQEEGFGVPVMEALALRVPVLCRDIPAFSEAGGDAVSYFPPEADARQVAGWILRCVRSRGNEGRRVALASMDRFADAVVGLARSGRDNGLTPP